MVFTRPHPRQELPVATTVAQLADTLQTLFTTTADRLAHDAGFIRRRRKLSGASFARALVFTWLDEPTATLGELAQATAPDGHPLTPQALDERFTPQAADFCRRLLAEALGHAFAAQPTAVALLRRFTGVYLLDSTCLALPAALAQLWPGCGGRGDDAACRAGLKLQVRLELNTGALEGLSLHPARQGDPTAELAYGPLPPGSLRLADLGYFDLGLLARYDQQQVYFVSRLQSGTVIYDADGRKWKLGAFLASRRAARIDEWVEVGNAQRLPCRLLAIRAPQEVARRRRKRAREQAAKKGERARAARLALCDWTLFITNAPGGLLSAQEAWVLYRVRWQIELLFKRWKSDGGLGCSRSGKAYRALCEVYAKLLALVVQHWVLLLGGGGFSEGSVRQAARVVRRRSLQLADALGCRRQLRRVLGRLGRLVRGSGRVNRRQRRPSTYQTLLDPEHDGLT
jgi:hypothetical protein